MRETEQEMEDRIRQREINEQARKKERSPVWWCRTFGHKYLHCTNCNATRDDGTCWRCGQ